MDRYRIAPARPVCLSAAGAGVHLRPAAVAPPPSSSGHRSSGAEIGIFKAERYFSAADVVGGRRDDAMLPLPTAVLHHHGHGHGHEHEHEHGHHHMPPRLSVPAVLLDVASSQSGRTAASSEASWNSRSGLLSAAHLAAARQHQQHTASTAVTVAGPVYGSGHHQGYRGGGSRRAGGGGSGSGQRWTLFGRDCPCAGRKAVTVVDDASEPRSPATATTAHFHAKFSPQSAVEECLESAIFKLKPPSPPRPTIEEEPAAKVTVTVTPGSRAFPLAAASADVPSFSNPDLIDRRVLRSSFTFPTLVGVGVLDEPPRVSLDVFRPIDEDSVVLPEDRPPPAAVGLLPPRGPPPAVDQDREDEEAMSDASSDLFDLESFAASSSYPTATTTYYRGRESRRNSAGDDDLPPYVSAEPALSECMYPASEASVVWSVATAEGVAAFDAASAANFSSAASACYVDVDDDLRYHHRYGYVGGGVPPESSPDEAARFAAAMMSRSSGARRKKSGGGGGFLSSCRCEKAVSVGPTPVRVVRPPAHPAAGAPAKAKRRSGGGGGDGASRYHQHHHGRAHVPVRT